MRIFRTIWFNSWLFLLIVLASALGTFLPQLSDNPEKVQEFFNHYPTVSPFLQSAGFFNIYHSWWFIGLLGLMTFDVILCKLTKFPRKRTSEDALTEKAIASSPIKKDLLFTESLERVAQELKESFRREKFHLRDSIHSGEIHIWASRHRLQRWGDFILHISIVGILTGGLLGAVWGFKEFLPVTEGGEKPLQNRPNWVVAVDRFSIEYYPETGTPSSYASDLRLLIDGQERARKKIIVNEPLAVDFVRFYQASWGMTGMVRRAVVAFGNGESPIAIDRGETVIIGEKLEIQMSHLLPDFDLDKSGIPITKSMEPNNPAIKFHFSEKGKQAGSLWLFRNTPDIALFQRPDGNLIPGKNPPLKLLWFDPVYFSGIQVSYDPGVILVALSWIILLLGLGIRFYLHQRRFCILIRKNDNGTQVYIGGWSSRGTEDFEPEFSKIVEECTSALHSSVSIQPS